ncbi:MAG: Nif3-like dinuclear metal center hexameric protein [Bacteroidota bacterium]
MLLNKIISFLEKEVPLSLQEPYDNCGLQTGDINQEIQSALITVDITEQVIDEAIETKSDLIISHHPLIFQGIKSVTGKNYTEKIIIKAIKNSIAIYSLHTNLDNIQNGVNFKIAEKLDLKNCRILLPSKDHFVKLSVFVPEKHAEIVRNSLFSSGGGHIGNYDCCSFNTFGEGSFRGSDITNPYVGKKNQLHFEKEIKIETIVHKHLLNNLLKNMIDTHPYEEVAYDIYPLNNPDFNSGSGLIGELEKAETEKTFLQLLKIKFNIHCIKHTNFTKRKIKKVALCGGSGSFLLSEAIKSKADIFISSDFKYHQFFDTENKILIADIGHYESEQFTKEIIYDLLIKKFANFALRLSKINTNPINYF